MNTKSNKHAGSNANPEPNETLPKDIVPKSSGASATDTPHVHSGKTITSTDGVSIVCFACYVEKTIQGTMTVLEKIIKTVSINGKKSDIEMGLALAEFALEGLLEELGSKQHGEGLPSKLIPVRGIPYLVKEKTKAGQTPVKTADSKD